ncbi:MAG: hypothetical protein JSU66_07185, partial [Deltaproteobacteria bacterium]
MKILQTMVFLFASLGLFALDAQAQNVRRSTLTGELVSRSATLTSGGNSVVLYVVPQGSSLIVTQGCAGPLSGSTATSGPNLAGSQLGTVLLGSYQLGPCTTFVPGVRFEGGEIITCEPPPFGVGEDS